MVSQDVFVGIDVSKDRLDVHVRPLGVGFSVSNEAAGYAALIARLRPLRAKRIVLEATGRVWAGAVAGAERGRAVAAVVNSRQVREFARAAGRLAKTDRLDAAVIAHFAETFYAAAGLRAGAERRLALLRAERQEIEREAIVDRDPRRRSLPA